MAYGRARRSTTYGEFWPGYVDVLSTLLLVVTFLMSVFMVSQFYVSQEASGKDTALARLTRQIAEITNLLSLEKGKGKSLEDELASLQASLATLRSDNERLTGLAAGGGDKDARISALTKELADKSAMSNAAIAKVERSIPKEIDWALQVDGHTDSKAIATPQFPSNWELSSARATSVVKYLIARGVPPKRLVAAGYGEFQPLEDGASEEVLRRNRRIELKLTNR